MNKTPTAYGLWSLVIINSLVFIIFAFSFTNPTNITRLVIVGCIFGIRFVVVSETHPVHAT